MIFLAPLHCGLRVSGSWLSAAFTPELGLRRHCTSLNHQKVFASQLCGSFQKPKPKRMQGELTSGTDVADNLFKFVLAFHFFFLPLIFMFQQNRQQQQVFPTKSPALCPLLVEQQYFIFKKRLLFTSGGREKNQFPKPMSRNLTLLTGCSYSFENC